MSLNTLVILRDDQLPSIAQWQRALYDAGINLQLDAIEDLRGHTGYLPAKLNGIDSGFEWYFGPVDEVFGQTPDGIGGRGHAASFVTHGEVHETLCALYAAGVLTGISNGLFFDEDAGAFVPGERGVEIAANWEASERQRQRQLAEQDADPTDRRCPECGAPCPSYRKTCKVCGYAIGRST